MGDLSYTERMTRMRILATCIRQASQISGESRLCDRIEDAIREHEKDHRAMGRRWVGRQRYRGTVDVAVSYFLVRVVDDGIHKYRCGDAPISMLRGIRTDFVLGALLTSEPRFMAALHEEIKRRFPDCKDVEIARMCLIRRITDDTEYTRDIVGGEGVGA